jgi:hypothetical protein
MSSPNAKLSSAAIHGRQAAEAVTRLNLAAQGHPDTKHLAFSEGGNANWQVHLDGSALKTLVGRPLLNLADPVLVRASESFHGELEWLSLRHPQSQLGALWDHLQGAYLSNDGHELVLALPWGLEILPHAPLADEDQAQLHGLCSLVLARVGHAHGVSAETLIKVLEILRLQWENPLKQRRAA